MDAGLNDTRMKMLGELAEMGLVLARDLQQAALVAEDSDEKVRLAEGFHRVGRGVRQSLALHAKFERDGHAAARERAAEVVRLDDARRSRRKSDVKAVVERLVWTEHENLDDPEDLLEQMDRFLDVDADAEGFLDRDPDEVIAELCKVLNLPSPPTPSPSSGPDARQGGRESRDPVAQTVEEAGSRIGLTAVRDDGDGGFRSSA
jgi:hypothetical protein